MGQQRTAIEYTRLMNEDVEISSSLQEIFYENNASQKTPKLQEYMSSPWVVVFNLLLFCFSVGSLMSHALFARFPSNWALRTTSFYSPMFDRYQITLEESQVIGPLFNEDSLSEHDILMRSFPSPESDSAWDAVTDVGVVFITGDEVARLGKDPTNTVKAPPEWGYGDDAHLAQLDAQHALHCLKAVRRYAYSEYYYPGRVPGNYSAVEHAHRAHCLHILLQTLTCNPSLDMITHNWVDTQGFPYPDFDINKKCIDHQQLLDWQSQNKISEEQWVEMSKLDPAFRNPTIPMPKQLAAWVLAQEKAGDSH